jgi:hypothetical protein
MIEPPPIQTCDANGGCAVSEKPRLTSFLLTPPSSWLGCGAFVLGALLTNLLATFVGALLGNQWWQVALQLATVIALLLFGGAIFLLREQRPPKILVSENERPAKHRGLIVLIGTGRPGEDPMQQSAWAAIEHHLDTSGRNGLQFCWLVASGGERGSLPVALEYKKLCTMHGITAETRTVEDAHSVQATYDVVRRIYEQDVPGAGLGEQDVIADITGGTSPMSAGMALACGERWPMQYMYGRKKDIATIARLMRFGAPQ